MRDQNHPLKLVIYLFIAFSFLFLSSKCKKEPQYQQPQLPLETQTGAGTFGCLVNGKVWLTTDYFVDNPSIDFLGIYTDRTGYDENGKTIKQSIGMLIEGQKIKVGKYYLDTLTRKAWLSDVITNCGLETRIDTNNFLVISKYDLVNRIISGRFQFTTLPPLQDTCSQKIITKGLFDLKL
ncbi:MAG: hypothetical protein HYX40_10620 [Sphingobacteriales bacterium]|nr:hypothetical protein [Sphingobacteriales bacterium]